MSKCDICRAKHPPHEHCNTADLKAYAADLHAARVGLEQILAAMKSAETPAMREHREAIGRALKEAA